MRNDTGAISLSKLVLWGSLIFVACVLLLVGGCAASKEFTRYQKRADAKNQVTVTHTKIKVAEQQARINRAQIEAVKAEADKRRAEAKGIRDAQDTIQATLTDRYLQHEAIQAQKAIATSGTNNSIIYVPAGANGVPMVQDIAKGTQRGVEQATK